MPNQNQIRWSSFELGLDRPENLKFQNLIKIGLFLALKLDGWMIWVGPRYAIELSVLVNILLSKRTR